MSNRIDRLFKEVLSEHKVLPSAEAWTKVQSGISKKNKITIVWRMAAVFVLSGALTGAWYLISNNDTTRQLTGKTEVVVPEKNTIDKSVEPTNKNNQPAIAQTTKSENRKKRNEINKVNEEQHSKKETIAMDIGVEESKVEEVVISTEPVLIAKVTKPEKPIVIEFTLPSLLKEPVVEIVQASEVESSGLKKVLETARDVKNGDSDLGIIRDARNQLFALDFKKDKTKRN
jgi:hypothetical protein